MPSDLTLDVGILMAASGLGAYEHHDASLLLAQHIEGDVSWGIALDSKGRIEQQYLQKLGAGTFGRFWLERLLASGRAVTVALSRFPKGVKVKLQEVHFDPEDFKYVETAASTQCRLLVSHDPDYSSAVCSILKKVNIRVVPAVNLVPGKGCDPPQD